MKRKDFSPLYAKYNDLTGVKYSEMVQLEEIRKDVTNFVGEIYPEYDKKQLRAAAKHLACEIASIWRSTRKSSDRFHETERIHAVFSYLRTYITPYDLGVLVHQAEISRERHSPVLNELFYALAFFGTSPKKTIRKVIHDKPAYIVPGNRKKSRRTIGDVIREYRRKAKADKT